MIMDSTKAPSFPDVRVHRDSLLPLPAEGDPLKPPRDSISPLDLGKKDVQKDIPEKGGKMQKKKKRPKVSIFF